MQKRVEEDAGGAGKAFADRCMKSVMGRGEQNEMGEGRGACDEAHGQAWHGTLQMQGDVGGEGLSSSIYLCDVHAMHLQRGAGRCMANGPGGKEQTQVLCVCRRTLLQSNAASCAAPHGPKVATAAGAANGDSLPTCSSCPRLAVLPPPTLPSPAVSTPLCERA